MRASLLIVALACMVALVSAQSSYTYTLKGTFYPTTACSGSGTSVSLLYSSSSAASYPCTTVGTGSTGYAIIGNCYALSIGNYWFIEAYQGYTCPSSGSGTPTGTGFVYGSATGTDFSTGVALSSGLGLTACFQPSGCSAASTLIVPSFLLVALAFAASKLQL